MITIETGKMGWYFSQTTEECRTGTYSSWYAILGPIHVHLSFKKG